MSDEKPWAEMTKEERGAKIKAGLEKKAADAERLPSISDLVVSAVVASGAISDEEREEIRKQAREDAKAKIAKELRAAEMKAIMDEIEAEERAAAGLEPATEHTLLKGSWPKYGPPPIKESDRKEITIGLPPFADAIRMDQKVFVNGYSYRVSPEQYLAIVDQQEWAWRHEDELHGKWRDLHPRQRNTHMNLNTARNYH